MNFPISPKHIHLTINKIPQSHRRIHTGSVQNESLRSEGGTEDRSQSKNKGGLNISYITNKRKDIENSMVYVMKETEKKQEACSSRLIMQSVNSVNRSRIVLG